MPVSIPEKSTVYQNEITINNNGDGGAGIAYYHPYKFIATQDVTILIAKTEMLKYIKIFLARAITYQSSEAGFGFGNKVNTSRLKSMSIMLPFLNNEDVDWQFIENYIKFIPNSDLI